ncbi:MAG: response regulator [Terracidiphilus sp.]
MIRIGANHDLPVILLIDDDMISREVIATLLTLHGYTVHSADDGAAALAMLDAGDLVPQVILMDAQLPGISGLELMHHLRKRCQASIFVISASEGAEPVVAAADGFLMKPFSSDVLARLIEGRVPLHASPIPETSEPVLSRDTLSQFRELMPESMVREVYAAVASDLKQRSEALREAIAAGNATVVRQIGHAIKGGCGMAGVKQAARLGAMLERESDQLDNSPAVLQDLYAATRSLERMLEVEFPAQTI